MTARVADRSFASPRRSTSGRANTLSHDRSIDRVVAVGCFALLVAANISFLSSKLGGMPVRSLVSMGILALVCVVFPGDASRAIRKNALLLGLAVGLALEGIFVSLANGAPVGETFQMVTEIHVQTVIILSVAAILAEIGGGKACMYAIVAVVGLTALFAFLQAAHLDLAWAARRAMGKLAADEINPSRTDFRPTGLSYSPIALSTQLCLAFAAFAAVRNKLRSRAGKSAAADPAIFIAVGIFILACLATGTRAPIAGGLLFLAVYLVMKRNLWLFFALLGVGLLAYLLAPLLMAEIQSHAPRVVRVDDNSVAARSVFVYFGLRLFAANPLGYGLTFAPSEMWQDYWSDLYYMRAAQGVQVHDLHNYVLSMLNIYGIGLLLFLPVVAKLLRRSAASLIFFIPYVGHIIFHNSGPFYNDMIVWFVIAAISATPTVAAPESETRVGLRQLVARRPALAPASPGALRRREARPW